MFWSNLVLWFLRELLIHDRYAVMLPLRQAQGTHQFSSSATASKAKTQALQSSRALFAAW